MSQNKYGGKMCWNLNKICDYVCQTILTRPDGSYMELVLNSQ